MSPLLRTSLIAVLLATSACKGPTDTPPRAGPPTNIESIVAPATASVATVPELRVRVTDRNGIPVEGVEIRWVGADGSSALPRPTNLTDANGEAGAEWWLGTVAKTYTASAHLLQGEDVNKVSVDVTTFTVNATAGPLDRLTKAGGDNQDSYSDRPPSQAATVIAEDRFGNPKAGVTIVWTGSANITWTPPTSVTGADGKASAQWSGKPATSGASTLTATAGSVSTVFGGRVCGPVAGGC